MTLVSDSRPGTLLRNPAEPGRRTMASPRVGPAPALVGPLQPSPPGPRDRNARPRHRRFSFTPRVSWSLAAAVPTVLVVGAVVEPAPNGPEPVAPLWLDGIALVTVMTALAAVMALVAVSRVGVWLAAVTAAGLFGLTLLCPMSGHHVAGAHTYVQFAFSGALLLASALILRLCRPSPDPRSRPMM